MLKTLNYITIIILLSSCKIHKATVMEGGGTYLQPIDSNLKKDIQIVHLGNNIGVVFPASFGDKYRKGTKWAENKTFFTPDTNLIKKIDKEVINQYCEATKLHNESYWRIELSKDDTVNLEKRVKEIADLISTKYCLNWQANSPYYAKQYMGYITANGEKIIHIKLLDFRQDPNNLKQVFTYSWIEGWHGWFYSNLLDVYFHVDKNLLTIGEDI